MPEDNFSDEQVDILHPSDSQGNGVCDIYFPFDENLTLDAKLHKAMFFKNSLDQIKCLIENGADVDSRGMIRNTPLMLSLDNDEYFEFFLANAKKLDASNAFNETALTMAFEKDYLDKAEKLLAAGADPSIGDSFKENAIDVAFKKGHIDLIKKYYDIKPEDLMGETLSRFHNLVEYGTSVDKLQQFIDLGVDINAKDRFDKTPLHNAIESKQIEMVFFLVEHGADLQMKSGFGEVPLLTAKLHSTPEIFDYLQQHDVELPKVKVSEEQTSLWMIFIKDIFKYIINKIF